MLNIDDWLFRNANAYQCDGDCYNCPKQNCENRLIDYYLDKKGVKNGMVNTEN